MNIRTFRGKYRWLSNFYPCRIEVDGEVYPTVEHAYQACKTMDPLEREFIRSRETPGEAKRAGKRVTLRGDWDLNTRVSTMYLLVRQKFLNDEKLRKRLIATGDSHIVEGNDWGDTFWGVSKGEGLNKLGKILMNVRDELSKMEDRT